jgi:hypothetical protein
MIVVTFTNRGGVAVERHAITDPGLVHAVALRSDWLVSVGQNFEFGVTAHYVPDVPGEPGSTLTDVPGEPGSTLTDVPGEPGSTLTDVPGEPGSTLTDATALGRVVIDPTWDFAYVPSERPLYAILEEVVQHGRDNPTHGTDCVCMDKFSYEVTRHVSRAVPPDTGEGDDVHSRLDGRFRIAHILRMVGNKL